MCQLVFHSSEFYIMLCCAFWYLEIINDYVGKMQPLSPQSVTVDVHLQKKGRMNGD